MKPRPMEINSVCFLLHADAGCHAHGVAGRERERNRRVTMWEE